MDALRVVWVEVSGFRRLQERSFFDFRDPRGDVVDQVVIAGTNGSGKTSLLEALLFGLGCEELITRDLPRSRRGDHPRGTWPPGARISICVQHGGEFLRLDRENGRSFWRPVATPLEPPFGTLIKFGPGPKAVEYFSSWRAPAVFGPVWPTAGGRKKAHNEGNRLQNLKQRLVDERTLGSYADGAPSKRLQVFNEAWASLHDQDGTTLADQPVDPQKKDVEAGFDLFILEPDGRRRCSIDQASAGEIEVLCLLGLLLDFSGVVLIDEPELHLHAAWQRRILPTLHRVAPRAQIITTSHASPPWEQAFSYQRYFLAAKGDPRASDLTPPAELG